jgi:hypothetical protein
MGGVCFRRVGNVPGVCTGTLGEGWEVADFQWRRHVPDVAAQWPRAVLGGFVNNTRNVDITADGKRIVALMPAAEAKGTQEAQNHLVFLMNFFDELGRRVPAGK